MIGKVYKMQDHKDKNVFHEAPTIEELINTIVKHHNDEYIRWSLGNWTKEEFNKFLVDDTGI